MKVLLVSTYELGHQPIHVASPASALRDRGHLVRCVDTSIDAWDPRQIDPVDRVAISVPMHTAMRLALDVARTIRARRPELPICLYGLYGGVAHEHLLGGLVDRMIAGEYETALADWVDGRGDAEIVHLGRRPRAQPARELLPPLDRYARLLVDGEARVAAAVQASHGCSSRCRHCPVPAVYDGRTRIVAVSTVLDDIDRAVGLGAEHITFADPDFFNGVHHSLRIVRAMHRRHPGVTFDLTTRIGLILRHRELWAELASAGCLFVTTALECVDDRILAILDKGHTANDAALAIAALRAAAIQPRPSLLPFTPWTTLDGLADLVEFAAGHDLLDDIDPVQWTMRLLIPDGSLLLGRSELAPFLDGYDPDLLGWKWHAADPRTDALHRTLAALVEESLMPGRDPMGVARQLADLITDAAGRRGVRFGTRQPAGPRLSEAWFCCAEPTGRQRGQTDAGRRHHGRADRTPIPGPLQ